MRDKSLKPFEPAELDPSAWSVTVNGVPDIVLSAEIVVPLPTLVGLVCNDGGTSGQTVNVSYDGSDYNFSYVGGPRVPAFTTSGEVP